jgi:tetratricopeptide (TPR) repeat protein
MKNTYITNTKSRKDRAIGYIQTINGFENTDWVIPDPPRADGGFWCTAEDLLRFYQNYYYGNFLLSDSIKNTDNYFNQIAPGYNRNMFAIDQAGGTNGHNSSLIQILKENISIIVLANMDEPVAEIIAAGIEQIIRGNEPENPKLPAILNAYKIYKEKGLTYLKDNFKNVISSLPLQDSKDVVLNNLGYQLLEIHKINEALEIFRLNTELFPDIGNVWDSYGEALLKKGDKKEALIAYKKALEINPELESSKSAIKKLK